jgi:hypothetical protein
LENDLSSTQAPTKFSGNFIKYNLLLVVCLICSKVESLTTIFCCFTVSQLPGPIQTALSALQQQLGEAIQQETAQTEERVRTYSEQQYAALEEFRERAHRDHRVLARYCSMSSYEIKIPPLQASADSSK